MPTEAVQPPFRRSGKIRQACDSCRARKIRCDGTSPCANCLSAAFECSYLAVHKKTGPKGPRRESRQHRYAVRPAAPPVSLSPEGPTASSDTEPDSAGSASYPGTGTQPRYTSGFRPSPLLCTEFFTSCLDAFFTHKYPITPILHRHKVAAALPHLADSPELYGLLTACCAVMVLSPEILPTSSTPAQSPSPASSPNPSSPLPTAEFLISEAIRARQFCDYVETPSLTTVQTSFFLFSAFFCLGADNSAWFYIREAMTTLQLLRLHEEATYATLPPDEAAFSRRMFWVLFITERAYALQRLEPARPSNNPAVQPYSHHLRRP
ncbi:RING-3 protein, partial [Coniochaeta hoffmannii]